MKPVTIESLLSLINDIIGDAHITSEQLNDDLSGFGMDSIMFIQVIVSIEEEFECEIPDSKLLFSEMNTVSKIYEVLASLEGEDAI